MEEVADKTLEADSFGPSDVLLALQSSLSRDELPGSPPKCLWWQFESLGEVGAVIDR